MFSFKDAVSELEIVQILVHRSFSNSFQTNFIYVVKNNSAKEKDMGLSVAFTML